MSETRIVYSPRSDATTEAELNALANVYAFILRCGEARRAEEMKKATRPGGPDDEMKGSKHDLATTDYTRP